ncbi:MAG: NAD(P)H-binding protein [Carboxylicivirga sp.]|jgi:uncharacterized protein YbjT (DUF2867 family)|nr:NAD(P)H-binding protein [Carboxylicivirga sp.]
MKQIAIFGGSGQLGQKVIQGLLSAGHDVTSFERKHRSSSFGEKNTLVDFNELEATSFAGQAVIVTLGTTQAKAGSAEAFIAVDYELVKKVAVWAKEQGVKEFHVISSIDAQENARGLYLQTKWKMEQTVAELNFEKLCIYRPSLYADLDRKLVRINEVASIPLLSLFASLTKKTLKYRPIKTDVIAKKVVKAVDEDLSGKNIFESDKIYSAAAISFKNYNSKEQKLLLKGIISTVLLWGIIQILASGSLALSIVAATIEIALSFLWAKSIITAKQNVLINKEEYVKRKKTKSLLRFLIWFELAAILGCCVFGFVPIAILTFTLLIFDVLFFYNAQDYLNSLN